MAVNLGGWIHSFTVTDTQTHKGGYTIYKITSIVFPRSVPQALTCLVVWKRFHDVKRLHRELNRRHKSLQLPGKLPEPTDSSYFKRFDADVIQRRKVYILELLDFTAQHPALYKCNAFAQFFSDAHAQSPTASPLHKFYVEKRNAPITVVGDGEQPQCGGGAIAEICDKLDLLYDPHDAGGITPLDPKRDKDDDNDTEAGVNNEKSEAASTSNAEVGIIEPNVTEQLEEHKEKPNKDFHRFLTPMASIESDDSDYIYEAALEFSHAVQAEVNLEYEEAHERYKRGVEVLLQGAKDDANDDRKFIAKAKITKYLARADEIYTRFLRDPVDPKKPHFQLSIDVVDNNEDAVYLERPWNQLAKYKVLQVLGERVMQVQCVTEPQKPMCIMKGVEKPSSNSPTQSIFLPQQVPYMVELLAYFQSDQKIFLLLKQAEGGLLYDYIQSYTPTAVKSTNYAQLFPAVDNIAQEIDALDDDKSNDDPKPEAQSLATLPIGATSDVNEIVRSSQALLKSVSNTLRESEVNSEQSKQQELQRQCSGRRLSKSPQRALFKSHIPEQCLKQWACELAVAIHSLHGKGIILRDLHMANILLGAKGQLMLTYFYQNEGLTADDNYVHKALSNDALQQHFVAPERPLTLKSDWWSYGVILYQLLIGLPYKSIHPGQIDLYGSVQYPDNVEISDNARDLLENLLQLMPETRLDYEQLQAHSFFRGTNWQEVLKNGLNSSNK